MPTPQDKWPFYWAPDSALKISEPVAKLLRLDVNPTHEVRLIAACLTMLLDKALEDVANQS